MENRLLLADERKRLALAALDDFAAHGNLRKAVLARGLPWVQFFHMRRADPDIRAACDDARLAAGYALVGEAIDIVDGTDEASAGEKVSDTDYKRARVRSETRFKIAERYAADELGPRSTVTHEGTINLLGTRIPDAENVLASTPRTYLTSVIDAEYVDAPELPNDRATDKQSGDPSNQAEPNAIDIFAE